MNNLPRRVLITGGMGFIGSYLVDTVIAAGQQCTVVDSLFHDAYPHIGHLEGRIDFHRTSVLDRPGLETVFERARPQDVYHLAAHHFIPFCDRHPTDALEVNVVGTQNVADLCARFEVEKVFVASTAAVYGFSDLPHTETECAVPMDIYGITKFAAERIGYVLTRRSAARVRVGRYFNAIGTRETNPHIIPEILSQLRIGGAEPVLRLGNVFPKRDYIHAADLAEASFAVLNANTSDPYDVVNIGSGCEWSVADLVELFSRELQVPIRIDVDSSKLRKVDRPHLCADIGKINRIYGWKPTRGLGGTIRELIEGIRAETPSSRV